MEIRWTGAGSVEISHAGYCYLVDPYISRPRKRVLFFRTLTPDEGAIDARLRGLGGRPSAIVVGHTHVDHALDIPVLAQRGLQPIVGSASLDTLLDMHGLHDRVTVCDGGERVPLPGNATVTMVRARHGLVAFGRAPYPGEIDPLLRPPLRTRDYRHGTVFIPLLEIAGTTVAHIGSANFVESELDGHRCDIALLCVPGWTKCPGYPDRVLEILRPEIVIPFHFDDFSAPLSPGGQARRLPLINFSGFVRRVRARSPKARLVVPEMMIGFSVASA